MAKAPSVRAPAARRTQAERSQQTQAALVRAAVEGLFASAKLDAIVYPTSPRRPALLAAPLDTAPAAPTASATPALEGESISVP